MIKLLRHISLSLTGLLLVIALLGKAPAGIIIAVLIVNLAGIFLSHHFSFLHRIMLPLNVLFLITGYLYGNSILTQLVLFLLILVSWDINGLFIDSDKWVEKKHERGLLVPLLLRNFYGVLIVLTIWFISEGITISIGFWPLLIIVLILIVILNKLFAFNR